MSDTLNLANSIWPNGMKIDSDGYAVFYPLGTNKIEVPTSTSEWPKGNKLVSPFVYQDDKLVGFVDTKALTVSSNTTIYLPYTHIEAHFSEIEKGQLQIHAPNATTKKVSWKDSGVEDIPEVQFKYKGCKTLSNVNSVDANYLTSDIVDGVWSEPLWDLTGGYVMFFKCTKLTSFNSDLSSLTNGEQMFYNCTALTSFTSDLSNLKNGKYMFNSCNVLTAFSQDLSSLTDGRYMFNKCTNLASFSSNLPSLEYGNEMFTQCDSLTSFNADLPSLTYGYGMFNYCDNLTSFTSNLPELTDGRYMFGSCINLTSFNADLPKLTDGTWMFNGCKLLTTFSADANGSLVNLSSLTNGNSMFKDCKNLTTFTSNLPKLTNGGSMFSGCSKLTTFNIDLPKLTNSKDMFYYCSKLTSFNSTLSSLTDGSSMFDMCSKLTSFNSALSSLTNGEEMFYNCKLDAPSVKNIINTIPRASGKLALGMGCKNTSADKKLFAQEVGYTDMSYILSAIQNKGWTVTAQYNGRPTTTYSLRRPTEDTLPVFVKLEETEDHANYTSLDGSKKFILNYFHETTGSTDGYTQFNSIEEAIETLNIKPIERN